MMFSFEIKQDYCNMGPVKLNFHNLILVDYDDVILKRSGNVSRTVYDNMLSTNLITTFRER